MKACCPGCGRVRQISAAIGAYADCLRKDRAGGLARALAEHRATRRDFALPLEAALAAGLTRVRLGNRHLLGTGY